MKNSLLFFFIVILLSACSNRPKNIIDEKKMVEIMTDLQIAEAYERNGDAGPEISGSNRELIGRGVLMAHGVSVEEMDSTLAWYGRNMDEYAKLYKKVDERLAKMQQKYARAAGESENNGPSMDIWPYGRHFVIDKNQMSDGLAVNIPLPEIAVGDKLTWKLRTHSASSRRMILGVEYDNGRSELVDNSNSSPEPWIEVNLQTDTLSSVARIFAILKVEASSSRSFIDSVQLLHYPFNLDEFHRSGYQRKYGVPSRKIEISTSDTTNIQNRTKIDSIAVKH